ncbi:hypothetical protein [Streptomyces luteireticuli]|uniref:hypothetical protein n=1 Tax=Streptomyces luteireticuli TaxID=173858 RepID=UPI0035591A55
MPPSSVPEELVPARRPGAGRRWLARLSTLAVTTFAVTGLATLATPTPAHAQEGAVETVVDISGDITGAVVTAT